MVVRHLGQTDFEIIMECFLLSFENYFVTMPTDHNFYKRRWKSSGVRLDLSFGMFDKNRLVGFIINSINERDSCLIAYNSGTGVIPKYRGRRIVKAIYDHAIPELLKKGISKCQLEVITENTNAIKSYEGIGFIKCKNYTCYKGKVTSKTKSDFVLTKVAMPNLNLEVFPNQTYYSWDNQSESLYKGDFDCFQISIEEKIQSYFIIDTKSGYLAQFEVLKDSPSHWNLLFSAIKSICTDIRINNIDNRLITKIKAVESAGLKNAVNQYEMELFIK